MGFLETDKYYDSLIEKINKNEIDITTLKTEEKFYLLKYAYRKSITIENIVILTQEEYNILLNKECPYRDDSDCLCHHCRNC